MKPKVINIRNAPAGWEINPAYVYIGRAGKGHRGTFGNPCELGYECPVCNQVHRTGGSTLECYRRYLLRRVVNEPAYAKAVKALWGKTLVCFCKPAPCHGDILATVCEELNQEDK